MSEENRPPEESPEMYPVFKGTPISDIITEHALVLMGDNGSVVQPAGTAVFIAPELAVTARHVIEDFWTALEQGPMPEHGRPTHCRFRVQALQFPGSSDTSPALWEMSRGWCSSFTDIAFLELRPMNDIARSFAWKGTLGLSLLPPSPGEIVCGFGYPRTSAQYASGDDPRIISYGLNGQSTGGKVLQVYPAFRDRGLLSFPCFEINARFDGGMSGGPLFNEKGRMCGLICASHPSNDHTGHLSWGASLWPAMVTEIEFKGPGVDASGPYSAFQLVMADVIHCEETWDPLDRRIEFKRHDNDRGYVCLRSEEDTSLPT